MAHRDYLALARQYEADVISGLIPACKWVKLACERNRRDLAASTLPNALFRFDSAAAVRVCAFVETMPHVEGDLVKPTYGDDGLLIWPTLQLEPWQCWIITTVFGWLKVSNGKRRFRIAFVMVPRKNGKSFLLSAIANYMLTSDGEAGAKCYSVATTRDQAKIVAKVAYEMAERLPAYRQYFGIKLGAKTQMSFSVPATASAMSPLSADAQTLDGLNIHFATVDELHAHPTRHIWEVVITAIGARLQPLVWAISTAGKDTAGICYELLTYLYKLLDQSLADDSFFGINYTVDEGDDVLDDAVLQKANPNYGVSIYADKLRQSALMARNSPGSMDDHLTKHCNVWVRGESKWAPMAAWHKAGDAARRPEQYAQYPCFIGVDAAEVRDIFAVVLVFKVSETQLVVFGRYYLPEATIAKSPIAQMSGWTHEQYLTSTSGDQADFARIEDDILALCQAYRVQQICFDRALAAQMSQNLVKKLGAKPEVLTVSQNVEVMNPAMQTVERLILSGQLIHDANPVMTWMLGNVVIQKNHKDEVFPRKAGGKDSPNKIDGPVALFTVIGQVLAGKPEEAKFQMLFGGGR